MFLFSHALNFYISVCIKKCKNLLIFQDVCERRIIFFSIILPEVHIFFENSKVAGINFSYKLGLTFKWTFKSKFQYVAGYYITDLIIFKIYIYFW